MRVAELIDDTARRFGEAGLCFGHGTDNEFDEAAWLVFSQLGLDHADAEAAYRMPVDAARRETIATLAKRRIDERLPLAYLLHEAWFAGHSFYVDERVLVPRSPIAELIARRFAPFAPPVVDRALDIGTGSGCIALAVALEFPAATVDAADVCAHALAVAKRNVERFRLRRRVCLWRSDLFAGLPDRRYRLIVANPPYLDRLDMSELPRECRHEPEIGLRAGPDGLDCVARILAEASRFLTDDGILVCEVGNRQPALEARYPQAPFFWFEFESGGQGVFLLDKAGLETL